MTPKPGPIGSDTKMPTPGPQGASASQGASVPNGLRANLAAAIEQTRQRAAAWQAALPSWHHGQAGMGRRTADFAGSAALSAGLLHCVTRGTQSVARTKLLTSVAGASALSAWPVMAALLFCSRYYNFKRNLGEAVVQALPGLEIVQETASDGPGCTAARLHALQSGLHLAPMLLSATTGAGLALGLVVGLGLLASVAAGTSWQQGVSVGGRDAATVCTLCVPFVVQPIGWSLLSGDAIGVVAGSALVRAGVSAAIALTMSCWVRYSLAHHTSQLADDLVAPSAWLEPWRLHADGAKPATVHGVPAAVHAKLDRLKHLLHIDRCGVPYWHGLPIMLLRGPAGTGKTTLAKALANALGADLLATSASELRQDYVCWLDIGRRQFETLLIEAQMRSQRERRLQVVFVDECTSLLQIDDDLLSMLGRDQLLFRYAGMNNFMLLGSDHCGVLLVLAANEFDVEHSSLLELTPVSPIDMPLPTAATLVKIFDDELAKLSRLIATRWLAGSQIDFSSLAALRSARNDVRSLAAAAASGRDIKGLVASLRIEIEALFGAAERPTDVDEQVRSTISAAAAGAVGRLRAGLLRCAHQENNRPPPIGRSPLAQAIDLATRLVTDPGAAFTSLLETLGPATSLKQSYAAQRIEARNDMANAWLLYRSAIGANRVHIGLSPYRAGLIAARSRYHPLHVPRLRAGEIARMRHYFAGPSEHAKVRCRQTGQGSDAVQGSVAAKLRLTEWPMQGEHPQDIFNSPFCSAAELDHYGSLSEAIAAIDAAAHAPMPLFCDLTVCSLPDLLTMTSNKGLETLTLQVEAGLPLLSELLLDRHAGRATDPYRSEMVAAGILKSFKDNDFN